MARPRKFYVVWLEYGGAVIVHGLATARKTGNAWKAFDRSHPYEYFFLDEKFQQQYAKEQRLTSIFTYFSSLAIFISCLGLIGLAIFTNELKVKEVGIRKTLAC